MSTEPRDLEKHARVLALTRGFPFSENGFPDGLYQWLRELYGPLPADELVERLHGQLHEEGLL